MTSWPPQEISSSIPRSAVCFFSSGKLFHGMYRLVRPVFHCPLSLFCPALASEETAAFRWPQVRECPLIGFAVHRKKWHRGKWYKNGVKKKKRNNIIIRISTYIHSQVSFPIFLMREGGSQQRKKTTFQFWDCS